MTDEYGFAASALTGMQIYEHAARGSGRTSRLVERATSYDQIVVATAKERDRLERLCRDAGKKPKIFVCDPRDDIRRTVGTAPRGRTFVDHVWTLKWFEAAVERAASQLQEMQADASKTWPEAPKPAIAGGHDSSAPLLSRRDITNRD
ncbi:MAG: hypothetical protein Q7S99_03245 [Parvibaculum sp.]|nr:hypothetical protein [Parvibaculum sp.]